MRRAPGFFRGRSRKGEAGVRLVVCGKSGVGRRYVAKLAKHGVTTALGLRDAPDAWVRKQMTVVGLRAGYELRGVTWLPLEEAPPARKSVCRSRTFGAATTEKAVVAEAVSVFASRAAAKLRALGLAVRAVSV